MRLRAAVLAFGVLAAQAVSGAVVTATAVVAAPYVAVGMYFGVDVTVHNGDATAVSVGGLNTGTLDFTRVEAVSSAYLGGSGAGSITLAPGADVTARWRFLAKRPGWVSIPFTVYKGDMSGNTLCSTALSVTILQASAAAGATAPGKGRMQIRGNIIRVSSDGRPADRSAYILLQGEPGGAVYLQVWGAGRTPLGRVMPSSQMQMTSDNDEVLLDGNGFAGFGWDGQVAGKPLDAGSYWIVATGAVKDRKPFLLVRPGY